MEALCFYTEPDFGRISRQPTLRVECAKHMRLRGIESTIPPVMPANMPLVIANHVPKQNAGFGRAPSVFAGGADKLVPSVRSSGLGGPEHSNLPDPH